MVCVNLHLSSLCLLLCSCCRALVWHYQIGTEIGTVLSGHTARVLCMCQSPDGSMVASAGADETLRIWNCFAIDPAKKKQQKLRMDSTASTIFRQSIRWNFHNLALKCHHWHFLTWTVYLKAACPHLEGVLQCWACFSSFRFFFLPFIMEFIRAKLTCFKQAKFLGGRS